MKWRRHQHRKSAYHQKIKRNGSIAWRMAWRHQNQHHHPENIENIGISISNEHHHLIIKIIVKASASAADHQIIIIIIVMAWRRNNGITSSASSATCGHQYDDKPNVINYSKISMARHGENSSIISEAKEKRKAKKISHRKAAW